MSLELESQVAKIQLGPEKDAKTFVYLSAEKLPANSGESFLAAEILESDSALHSSCEQIVLSIGAAIKRAFKKNAGDETFESAVAQVNEELAKLASLGQVHWIDKLNCIIGVKTGQVFNIATTGKVAAFLLRNGELTDLSCSAPKAHPLKTFENFAAGKLRLNDILILSTNQLFNYLSVDRLKRLVDQDNFLKAAGQIVEILKANTEGGVSLGTILAQQKEAGTVPEQEIDLEEYVESAAPSRASAFAKVWQFIVVAIHPNKKTQIEFYEKPSLKTRLNNMARTSKAVARKTRQLFSALLRGIKFGRENFAPSQIRQFSPQKKFFFFCITALLLALVLQITTAIYLKSKKETANKLASAMETAKKALSDADAALLYKDEPAAKEFYLKSQAALANITKPDKQQKDQVAEIKNQSDKLKVKLEKTLEIAGENLGTLASASHLIKLPEFLAVQTKGTVISWKKGEKAIRDDLLKINIRIELSESVDQNRAAVYNGEGLAIWNYESGNTSAQLTSSVPAKENAVGLKLYPTNQRVYMLDKAKNQIFNFGVLGDSLGKPQASINLKNDDAKNAVDLAIDGSIYVLTGSEIKKYHAGQQAEFGPLSLLTPLNGANKIIARTDFANIYILDRGNRRIVVLNKKGGLVYTLTSPDFTDLVDFEVEEKNKVIYVLNGASLFKVNLP